jgi:hypothetical protein
MPSRHLSVGDEVAILPSESSPAAEVMEIVTISYVGSVHIQLNDGRMYATIGGKSLGASQITYIVPATAEHRVALRPKAR